MLQDMYGTLMYNTLGGTLMYIHFIGPWFGNRIQTADLIDLIVKEG